MGMSEKAFVKGRCVRETERCAGKAERLQRMALLPVYVCHQVDFDTRTYESLELLLEGWGEASDRAYQ